MTFLSQSHEREPEFQSHFPHLLQFVRKKKKKRQTRESRVFFFFYQRVYLVNIFSWTYALNKPKINDLYMKKKKKKSE